MLLACFIFRTRTWNEEWKFDVKISWDFTLHWAVVSSAAAVVVLWDEIFSYTQHRSAHSAVTHLPLGVVKSPHTKCESLCYLVKFERGLSQNFHCSSRSKRQDSENRIPLSAKLDILTTSHKHINKIIRIVLKYCGFFWNVSMRIEPM